MKSKLLIFCLITFFVTGMAVNGQSASNQSKSVQKRDITLVSDMDGDGKMDSVFVCIALNSNDDWEDRYGLECKLSVLNYKSISCKDRFSEFGNITSRYQGFSFTMPYDSSTMGEFEFEYNPDKKNMQLTRVTIWVGADAGTIESECLYYDKKWECRNKHSELCPNPIEEQGDNTKAIFLDSDVDLF